MASITDIIRERALANGVDPSVLLRMAQIESGLNPNAAASGSSAKGLLQFTDGTWKSYGGSADPYDPTANADAGARLLRDNAAALRSAGIEPNPGSLYLAHFAGLGGAQKLLSADPAAPAGSVLGDAAVRANPFLAKMTVGDVRNWAAGKMGGEAPASPAAPSGPAVATAQQAPSQNDLSPLMLAGAPQPQQQNGTIATLQRVAGAFAPPEPPQAAVTAPDIPAPRRIDPQALLTTLRTPLLRGSSFGGQV